MPNASHQRQLKKRSDVLRKSSLADALFTSTQQRVLALLFGQPDRSFYVNEIMGLADSGRGAVQRELGRLGQSGLVTITKVGNQKHYQANKSSPLYDELCSIIKKTVGLEGPVRAALNPLAEKISLALIYGSIAKEADTAASDIDLLLVSDELTLEEIYAVLAPLEELLNRRVNPTLYTSKEFNHRQKAKNAFVARLLEGPIIVLWGSVDGA
jgi:predicted nucleotidyltransferase